MNFLKSLKKFLFVENKKYMISYILCLIFATVSNIFNSSFVSKFIKDKDNKLIPKILGMLLINMVSYIILNKLDSYFIPKVQSFCHKYVIHYILNRYKYDYKETNTGEILSKLVKLPYVVRELFFQFRSVLLPLVINTILTFLRLLMLDVKVACIYMVLISSSCFVLYKRYYHDIKLTTSLNTSTDMFYENVNDLFDNILDIYCFGTYDTEMHDIENNQKKISQEYSRSFKNTFTTLNIINVYMYITTGLIVLYSYHKTKNITDEMILCAFSIFKFVTKISNYPEIIYNMGVYKEIIKTIDNDDVNIYDTDFKPDICTYDINIVNLSIKYDDTYIIKNFNTSIKENECVIIYGKIGCGKSSLVKSILRLKDYEGDIYLGEYNIKNINVDYYRNHIFFIKQNPLPFNRSIYDILLYGTSKTKSDVDELIENLKLHDIFGKDRNLNSSVGKKGSNLSGGQRMILYILKIFLIDKQIIILDEPTSSLDTNTSMIIINILKNIIGKKTIIIVSHDEKLYELTKNKINLI